MSNGFTVDSRYCITSWTSLEPWFSWFRSMGGFKHRLNFSLAKAKFPALRQAMPQACHAPPGSNPDFVETWIQNNLLILQHSNSPSTANRKIGLSNSLWFWPFLSQSTFSIKNKQLKKHMKNLCWLFLYYWHKRPTTRTPMISKFGGYFLLYKLKVLFIWEISVHEF